MVWYGMVWYGMVWYGMVYEIARALSFFYQIQNNGHENAEYFENSNPDLSFRVSGVDSLLCFEGFSLSEILEDANQ